MNVLAEIHKKSFYCFLFYFNFLRWRPIKNSFRRLKTPKLQMSQGKAVLCSAAPRHVNSVNLGKNVSFCPTRVLVSVRPWLSSWRSACGVGPRSSEVILGQMRVSWCQRLDGRMLSTFSMMKFRGAKRVLRNCRDRDGEEWPHDRWATIYRTHKTCHVRTYSRPAWTHVLRTL